MTLINKVMDILGFRSKKVLNTCDESCEGALCVRPYQRQLEHHKRRLEIGGQHDDFHRHMISHCELLIETIEQCERK